MPTAALLCLALLTATPDAGTPAATTPTAAVNAVLDDWHKAAAQADEARYFGHFTPDAVYLGTDATERWTRDEFRAWAKPYFSKGKAWSFTAVSRHVSFSKDGAVAWFDEALATPNMGPARGSGVLVKDGGTWKIAQYNLSIPIPNDLMDDFKARIEAHAKKQKGK
ncbi:nuclear transport factor 2 family protein [Archangium lansingense]|uniref:Nuclear transport factor 2 family protein n=1 Tax=Archangium lansingense TaxID=2995310 RepID=A0ABT4AN23_9BACT|nr:nuclear transport factor 2 family protein [Archangium lansinium]MCY1083103.1 nuclear transport factor 2 family protein [Archangium lansinium]